MAISKKSNSTFRLIILITWILCIQIKFGHLSSVEKSRPNFHPTTFQTSSKNQTHQIDRNYPPLNATEQSDLDDSNDSTNQTETKNMLKEYLLKKLDLSQPTNLADTKVPGFLLDIFETKSFESNSFRTDRKNRVLLINNSNTIRSHPIIEQRRSQKSKRNKSGYPDVIDDFVLEEWENFKSILLSYSNHHALGYDNDSWKDSLDFMNKKKRDVDQQDQNYSTPSTGTDWKSGRTKDCARYSMYVDFRELGWDRWIVTPDGYDAHVCYGDCSLSAVRKDMNASNHATAQALSNSLQPSLIPPPCCVPAEFSPLLLVYKDGDASIVRIYEDMIVTSCACR